MTAPERVRVRFAPSPTGTLHLGNARTALFNWLFAGRHGGALLLRIEDTDAERSRPEHEQAILRDLEWLGLDWSEGPDIGGPVGPYRQSERRAAYDAAAARLVGSGAAYACACDPVALEARRREAEGRGEPFRYDGRCRDRGVPPRIPGAGPALRLRLPDGEVEFVDGVYGAVRFAPAQYGDPVLRRSDGSPNYNFAAAVDDAAMAITDVLRGEDHLTNSAIQILLHRALGAEPPRYAHLPMILGRDGARLSKRHGAASIDDLRASGYLPEAVINALALLGWSHPAGEEVLAAEDLLASFDLARVSRAAATFDSVKLDWFNGQWLRRLPRPRLVRESLPWLRRSWPLPEPLTPDLEDWLGRGIEMCAGGAVTLPVLVERMAILFRFEPSARLADPEIAAILSEPGAASVSAAVGEILGRLAAGATPPELPALKDQLRQATGLKGRNLFHPLRALLTGYASGPELDRLLPLLEEGSRLGLVPVPPWQRARALLASAERHP
jgi:glutamyl-tRNA synthetase